MMKGFSMKKIQLKLFHKFLLTLFFASFLGLIVFSVVKINLATYDENHSIENKIDLLRSYTALQFSNPVWHFNKPAIRTSVEAFFKDEEIASMKLTTTNGEVLIHESKVGDAYKENYLIPVQEHILYDGENIGIVEFSFSTYYRELKLKKDREGFLYLVAFILALQILFLTYFVKQIVKPITQLKTQTHAVASGNLSELIDVRTHDELGELASEFNTMILKLKQSNDDRQWAFEAVEKSKLELEIKVMDRTAELFQTNMELDEKNKTLEQTLEKLRSTQTLLYRAQKMADLARLVGGIAHEVNTPIGNCITTTSFLKEVLESNTLPPQQLLIDGISIIDRNLEKVTILMNNLKDLNQMDLKNNKDTVNLYETVQLAFKEVTLVTDHPPKLIVAFPQTIEIVTQKNLLLLIIKILIENTIIHGNDTTDHLNVTIDFIETSDSYTLYYADDGEGISDSLKNKIFDSFFSTKPYKGHLGLGLFIAQEVLTLYLHGKIELLDTPITEKGVRFKISFPKDFT